MSGIFKAISVLFLDLVETGVIGLSLFLVIYLFFVQPHQVNGQSMVPNFQNGEYLLTDKVSYKFGLPKRGDVVVFHAPDGANCPTGTGCDFIKRVIATPGETVELRDNIIVVNGQPLPESYLPSDFVTEPGDYSRNRTVIMEDGEYFLVGDNRSHSSDSRAWGPVPIDRIVGRAFLVYWPMSVAGLIPKVSYPF